MMLGGAAVLAMAAGCNRQSTPAAPPAPVAANPPATSSAPAAPTFQPYTVLTQPPPKPAVVKHLHRTLRLVRSHDHASLADTSGRVYDVGRDSNGRIYPVYRSPSDGHVYPLYYDSRRDRYYRVVKDDQGRFLRGYADDPDNQYYTADQDYENYTPSVDDRPIINNYYSDSGYSGSPYSGSGAYHPSAPSVHHHGHQDEWLWAIPVVVGAYFLLRPHHSNPQTAYPPRPRYARPFPGAPPDTHQWRKSD